MITEYNVLSQFKGHRDLTLYEVTPSQKFDDLYDTNAVLNCLLHEKFIEIISHKKVESGEDNPVYAITDLGEYRLIKLQQEQSDALKSRKIAQRTEWIAIATLVTTILGIIISNNGLRQLIENLLHLK